MSQTISNARLTCEQHTSQSQLRDPAINCQGIEMVSIRQIFRVMQKKIVQLAILDRHFCHSTRVVWPNCTTLSHVWRVP